MPDSPKSRLEREKKTVRAMIALYCRGKHGKALCPECEALWEYAQGRVERCPFREQKPTCLKCRVHCYESEMREHIRAVMRYSGPRMLRYHPSLALLHLFDGFRR